MARRMNGNRSGPKIYLSPHQRLRQCLPPRPACKGLDEIDARLRYKRCGQRPHPTCGRLPVCYSALDLFAGTVN